MTIKKSKNFSGENTPSKKIINLNVIISTPTKRKLVHQEYVQNLQCQEYPSQSHDHQYNTASNSIIVVRFNEEFLSTNTDSDTD